MIKTIQDLKKYRESKNWSQRQFCDILGISRGSYAKLEWLNKNPSPEILEKINQHFFPVEKKEQAISRKQKPFFYKLTKRITILKLKVRRIKNGK